MWNEKISLTFPFLVITNIINCDLIVEGDETLKAEELLLTKIDEEDDNLIKAFNQKLAQSNLQSPLLFQMQHNLQFLPVSMSAANFRPPPHQIPNLMYSSPSYDGMSIPSFQINYMDNQPILVKLPIDIFSNTYKDPYENHNHLLRDNMLDNFLFKQVTSDFSNYNFIHPSHQQMLQNLPIHYAPQKNFGRVNSFATSISSPNYDNPNLEMDYRLQKNGFYSNLGQQSSIGDVYSQQQQQYLYGQQINGFNHLNGQNTNNLYQGTRYEPADIEVIKSIGYSLPAQVSIYHPEKTQRFLDTSENNPSQQIYAVPGMSDGHHNIEIIKTIEFAVPKQISTYYPEKIDHVPDRYENVQSQHVYPKPLTDNWTKNNNDKNNKQLQYQVDHFNGHKVLENLKTRISNQYYHSNTKPITFDNYYAEHPESLKVRRGNVSINNSPTNTNMKVTNVLNSQGTNLTGPTKVTDTDDNIAEDTRNIDIEIEMETKSEDKVHK